MGTQIMFDDILICLVALGLVFAAGLYVGSKRPVRRELRNLANVRADLAACKADIAAVTPLKTQAQLLAASTKRLASLTDRRNEIEHQLSKLTANLSDLRYRQEHGLLSTTDSSTAPGRITHWSCEKARLGEELATVVAELRALELSVKEQTAALDAARSSAMVDLGLGHTETFTSITD